MFGLMGLDIYTEHILVHSPTLLNNLAESYCLLSDYFQNLTSSHCIWSHWSESPMASSLGGSGGNSPPVSPTTPLPFYKLFYQPAWILSLLCSRNSNSSSFHWGKSQSRRRSIITCTLLTLFIRGHPCWPPGFSLNRSSTVLLKPLYCLFPLCRKIYMADSFSSVKFWFDCHLSMGLTWSPCYNLQ